MLVTLGGQRPDQRKLLVWNCCILLGVLRVQCAYMIFNVDP